MTVLLLLAALAAEADFPERAPSLIEACLNSAVAANEISKTRTEHKYMCVGDAAKELWNFLESSKVKPWDQTTDSGVWSSRDFPMGGCFKRIRNPDGSTASTGLSCSIWIPYRKGK